MNGALTQLRQISELGQGTYYYCLIVTIVLNLPITTE